MRMDLTADALAAPAWPAGISAETFDLDRHLAPAHALLTSAYADGGGSVGAYAEWRADLLADPEYDPALCFIATDADVLVGFAQCWTSGFVKDLAVHPDWRRRGLGRALMQTVFREFARRGATHVDLKVADDNPLDVAAFYRSLGMIAVPDPH
jgi:ribosomal protein S18 acetylase RimI-like enzyme